MIRRGAHTIQHEEPMSRNAYALVLAGAVVALPSARAGTAYQVASSPSSREISLVGEFGNQIILHGYDSA